MDTPKHLKTDGATFFQEIISEFAIADPAGLALLTVAAECLDRMRQAQVEIKKHGPLVPDRWGVLRANPMCALETTSRTGFMSALKALRLDVEPLHITPGRPPGS